MTIKINVDNRTIIRVMVVVVAFVLAITFIRISAPALTLIFISFFFALALNPPVTFLANKITKGSRMAATGIAYLLVLLLITGFLWALIPPVARQSTELIDKLPQYIDEFSNGDSAIAEFAQKYNLDEEVKQYSDDFTSDIGNTSGPIFDSINRVGVAIVSVLTVLVLTFFMLVEGPAWLDKFWAIQNKDGLKERRELANRMYHIVTGYVNGQLLIATTAAMTSLIMMLIIGIPYPLALAGLVGFFSLIPLVGATLGSIVVVIVALFQSVYAAIAMLVFFLIYQQVENNAIQPFIQSRTLDVSPLLVLVAVVIGINFGGLLGGLIAIPAAASIRILINDQLERHGRVPKSNKTSVAKT